MSRSFRAASRAPPTTRKACRRRSGVRHYQTTDDGQRLPAILMFHPDYEFVDTHGNPIAVPPDRVVPPQLVPPGLDATHILEPPDQHRAASVP